MKQARFAKCVAQVTATSAAALMLVQGGLQAQRARTAAPTAAPDALARQAHVLEAHDIALSPFGLHYLGKWAAEAAPLDFKWVRPALMWFQAEPKKGLYLESAAAGAELDQLNARGVQCVPHIMAINPWAASPKVAGMNRQAQAEQKPTSFFTYVGLPSDLDAYANFVRHYVKLGAAKGIDYWQIENEWDWRWQDSPENFVRLLKTASTAIREANPRAKVVLGGMADVLPLAFADGCCNDSVTIGNKVITREMARQKYARQESLIKYVLAYGKDYFDIVDFHQYGFYAYIDESTRWLRDQMKASGYERPLWIMEGGGPFAIKGEPYSDESQAQEVLKYYAVALGYGIQVFYWSTFSPTMEYGNSEYGRSFVNISLVGPQGSKKPAYFAYQLLTSKLGDVRRVERLSSTPGGLFVYRFFTKAKQPSYLLWNDSRKALAKPELQRLATALAGKTLRVTTLQGQERILRGLPQDFDGTLGPAPVFVEIR